MDSAASRCFLPTFGEFPLPSPPIFVTRDVMFILSPCVQCLSSTITSRAVFGAHPIYCSSSYIQSTLCHRQAFFSCLRYLAQYIQDTCTSNCEKRAYREYSDSRNLCGCLCFSHSSEMSHRIISLSQPIPHGHPMLDMCLHSERVKANAAPVSIGQLKKLL